jgi:hypothetical protein
MGALVDLAVELLPLLIKAGMDIEPTIARLVHASASTVDADIAFLHQQRADALARINDKSHDVG